jgi:hypothetical protein
MGKFHHQKGKGEYHYQKGKGNIIIKKERGISLSKRKGWNIILNRGDYGFQTSI